MMTSLYFIQQYTLYVGYFLLTTGILGNSMNIYIISAVKSYRSTPCMFYFLIASIYNILVICIGLLSRILETGHELDQLNTSVVWCKIRQYFITSISIIPTYCQCLATIDQFLITSTNARLRQISTMRRTYWNNLILTIIALLHGIPFLIYSNIVPEKHLCAIISVSLNLYFPVFILGIFLLTPIFLSVIFALLTYRNIHRSKGLSQLHADRQLTSMVCMQIILIICATIPYAIYNIYSLATINTAKSEARAEKEFLVSTIISLNTYVNTGGSFYVFMASSSRFRQTVKKRIFCWQTFDRIGSQ